MKIDRYRKIIEDIMAGDELPKKITLLSKTLEALGKEQPKVYTHCSLAIDSDTETNLSDWQSVYYEFFNNARFGVELGNRWADNPDATQTANTKAFCVLCDNMPDTLNQWEGEPINMQRPEEITETICFINTEGRMEHKVATRRNPYFMFARYRGNSLFQLGRMVQRSNYDPKEPISVVTLKLLLYIAIKNELADLNTEADIIDGSAPEPLQQSPNEQRTQIQKPKKKNPCFRDCIQFSDQDLLLERLHELIDGKKGADVGSIILRARYIDGYLSRNPTQAEFKSEFRLTGSWKAIHNYMNDNNQNAIDRANKVIIFKVKETS